MKSLLLACAGLGASAETFSGYLADLYRPPASVPVAFPWGLPGHLGCLNMCQVDSPRGCSVLDGTDIKTKTQDHTVHCLRDVCTRRPDIPVLQCPFPCNQPHGQRAGRASQRTRSPAGPGTRHAVRDSLQWPASRPSLAVA
eukprot:gene3644-4076_t